MEEEKNNIGYCKLHKEEVNLSTFEFKGCWTCRHFHNGDILIDVTEAASILEVSETTIRRWIKEEKLNGRLFRRIRQGFGFNPLHKKYYIERESVKSILNNR